jgi:hypothetical protein
MRLLLGSLLLACVPALAMGQTRASTSEIAGRIVDRTSGVLPGATIVALHRATNVEHRATADAEGRFALPGLPVGAYQVAASLVGFATTTLPEITLAVGERADLAITLELAAVATQVDVTAAGAVVDLQKTSISAVLSERQIMSLPSNGRDFISFATLTPGVATDRGLGALQSSGLSFAGQRGRSNNISLDGFDNNGVNLGDVRATISQDAVREFQVMTSSFSAEFGKASGGVLNIVSRSGTNAFSGGVFGFFRDDALNGQARFEEFDVSGARVDRDKAPFSQSQIGFTIGGPIRRDQMFFFGSYERLRREATEFVSIDDSTIVMHPFAPVALGTTAGILRAAGFPVETGYQPANADSDQYFAKFDAHSGGRDWWAVRVHGGERENLAENFGGIVAPSRAATLNKRDVQFAAWWLRAPSDRWLNDVRVQFARDRGEETPLDPRCGGPCTGDTQGGPALEVLGFASVGRNVNAPAASLFKYLQVLDTVSFTRGAHQLKTGLDIGVRWISTNRLPLNFGGQYVFASLSGQVAALFGLPGPISAIQAVAINLPVLYVQGYGNPDGSGGRNYDASFFLQDDWRVRSDLTLKFGLRYQAQGFSVHALDVPGVSGTYDFPKDGNNLAPRLALAWSPRDSRVMRVHASYGVSYDRVLTSLAGTATILNPRSGVRTLVGQGALPIIAWSAPGHVLPEAAAGAYAATTVAVDRDLKTPYTHQFSTGVERELTGGLSVSASVLIVNGHDIVSLLDYNPLVPALGPGRRPDDVNGVPGSSASVLQYTGFGQSWYRGLLLSAERRFSKHAQFLISYTLSKTEDSGNDFNLQPGTAGAGRDPADPDGLPIGFDPARERGPSPRDQRHRFVVSGLYELPHGVTLSAIIEAGSGRPYNITAGQDLNGDGTPGTDRPLRVLGDLSSGINRNAGTLPAESSFDVRVSWRHRLGSRARAEWMFDVFNLFNRVNYTDANGVFGPGPYPAAPAPGFGQFTQAGAPRQAQIALRISF